MTVEWTDQAKSDLRAIDRSTALSILQSVARYLATREGDVKRL
jgi:plasmid stabilization system protein ParE